MVNHVMLQMFSIINTLNYLPSLFCNQLGLPSLIMDSFHFCSATGGHPLPGYVHVTIQQSNMCAVANWHLPLRLQQCSQIYLIYNSLDFLCYFKICNSLFSICQLYACYSALLFTLSRPCKTEIFSISQLACQLNAQWSILFHKP